MKHNKYDLKCGDKVFLDKDYHDDNIVKIFDLTPLGLLACVYPAYLEDKLERDSDCWEVMSYRLLPLN